MLASIIYQSQSGLQHKSCRSNDSLANQLLLFVSSFDCAFLCGQRASNVVHAQGFPAQVVETGKRNVPVNGARCRDHARLGVVEAEAEDARHETDVYYHAPLHIHEVRHPKHTTQVRLSYLGEWDEVAVHEAGNEEIHETKGVDEGRKGAVHKHQSKHERVPRGPRTDSVVILVLWLAFGFGNFLPIKSTETQELHELHRTQHVLGMRHPLQREEMQVEMGGKRHRGGQQIEDVGG